MRGRSFDLRVRKKGDQNAYDFSQIDMPLYNVLYEWINDVQLTILNLRDVKAQMSKVAASSSRTRSAPIGFRDPDDDLDEGRGRTRGSAPAVAEAELPSDDEEDSDFHDDEVADDDADDADDADEDGNGDESSSAEEAPKKR